jgi:hypothetical protein
MGLVYAVLWRMTASPWRMLAPLSGLSVGVVPPSHCGLVLMVALWSAHTLRRDEGTKRRTEPRGGCDEPRGHQGH